MEPNFQNLLEYASQFAFLFYSCTILLAYILDPAIHYEAAKDKIKD
jgi:hypothetical protein